MYKVTGISTLKGQTKVRFANDLVSRVKILNKDGHSDVNLFELPSAMSKGQAVTWLKTIALYHANPQFTQAIDTADAKYNGPSTVKVKAHSLEAIKARAGIVEPEVA